MRISDWSSDVCSSDLRIIGRQEHHHVGDLPGFGAAAERFAAGQLIEQRFRRALAQVIVKHDRRRHRSDAHAELGGLDRTAARQRHQARSEEHSSELQSLMRISYAVLCLKKKKENETTRNMEQMNTHARIRAGVSPDSHNSATTHYKKK